MRMMTGLMLLIGMAAGAAADGHLRQNQRDAYALKMRAVQVNLCAKGDRQ